MSAPGRYQVDDVDELDRQFQKRVREAATFGRHVWVAVVAHHLPDEVAQRIAVKGGPLTLEGSTVVDLQVGCYRCEEPLTAGLLSRACTGGPE